MPVQIFKLSDEEIVERGLVGKRHADADAGGSKSWFWS